MIQLKTRIQCLMNRISDYILSKRFLFWFFQNSLCLIVPSQLTSSCWQGFGHIDCNINDYILHNISIAILQEQYFATVILDFAAIAISNGLGTSSIYLNKVTSRVCILILSPGLHHLGAVLYWVPYHVAHSAI